MLVGNLKHLRPGKRLPTRVAEAALLITLLELGCGLLVNRSYRVWDYRNMPLNFLGQICLGYSLLWIPVGMGGIVLYRLLERALTGRAAERL